MSWAAVHFKMFLHFFIPSRGIFQLGVQLMRAFIFVQMRPTEQKICFPIFFSNFRVLPAFVLLAVLWLSLINQLSNWLSKEV